MDSLPATAPTDQAHDARGSDTTGAESTEHRGLTVEQRHQADDYIAALLGKVRELRQLDPGGDWAARIYHCLGCQAFDFVAAPQEELIDRYPCPNCGADQVAVVPVRIPTTARRSPNRARRRARR